MDGAGILSVLHEAATAVRTALDDLDDWGLAGTREGQYRSDLVADRAALDVLLAAGFGVHSEESGLHHPERELVVVVDPVDGSTNASRSLPWWATSLCALDRDGPVAAVVVDQAGGNRFEATRGGGARENGTPLEPSATDSIDRALIASNGWPAQYLGWNQFRCLGAAALDLCAVASGRVDGFIDCGATSLAPWDYLGALLVCQEAGAVVTEAFDRDLIVREHGPRRTVIAAGTPGLLSELVTARRQLGPPG